MAIFDPKSRYAKYSSAYHAVDRRGRTVLALGPALVPSIPTLGIHRRKQGQRLDHLAAFYLQDANGFWRIASHNNVLLPEALSEVERLDIPVIG